MAPDSVNEKPVDQYLDHFYFDPDVHEPIMRKALIQLDGVDRFVYGDNLGGSDNFEGDLTEGIGLSDQDREKIRSGNALKLLERQTGQGLSAVGSSTVQDTLHAEVNRSKCSGYGICADLCPEVFVLDDQGFATVAVGSIPESLHAAAREAAYECPEEAIDILNAQHPGGPHAAGRDPS